MSPTGNAVYPIRQLANPYALLSDQNSMVWGALPGIAPGEKCCAPSCTKYSYASSWRW